MTARQKKAKEKILENEKVIDDLLKAWFGSVIDTYKDTIGLLEVESYEVNNFLEIYVETSGDRKNCFAVEAVKIDWEDLRDSQQQTILQYDCEARQEQKIDDFLGTVEYYPEGI